MPDMGRPRKIKDGPAVTPEDAAKTQALVEAVMAEQASQPSPPSSTAPRKITTLDELSAIVDKPLTVEIDFLGQVLQIDCRRLTPAESAILSEIVDEAIPPVIKGRTMDEDRPDYDNPAFLKKKALVSLEARAMAIYWCVPMFNQAKPGLTNRSEITAFVQSKLNDGVLRALWQSISMPGVNRADLVNFT